MDNTGTGKAETQTEASQSAGAGETAAVTYRRKNPRSSKERVKITTVNNDVSMTDTSQANDTDVNNIIARFDRTGVLPQPTQQPQYADCVPFNRDLTELISEAEDVQARARDFIEKWSPTPEPTPPPADPTPQPAA